MYSVAVCKVCPSENENYRPIDTFFLFPQGIWQFCVYEMSAVIIVIILALNKYNNRIFSIFVIFLFPYKLVITSQCRPADYRVTDCISRI